MKPEKFALHAKAVDKDAYYTVYRPNQGYQNDECIERCEEYDNVTEAIRQTQMQISTFKQEFYDLQYQTLRDTTPENRVAEIERLTNLYDAERDKCRRRLNQLENEAKALREKHGIIRRFGGEVHFQTILLEELYASLGEEKFQAAVRSAKRRFQKEST